MTAAARASELLPPLDRAVFAFVCAFRAFASGKASRGTDAARNIPIREASRKAACRAVGAPGQAARGPVTAGRTGVRTVTAGGLMTLREVPDGKEARAAVRKPHFIHPIGFVLDRRH